MNTQGGLRDAPTPHLRAWLSAAGASMRARWATRCKDGRVDYYALSPEHRAAILARLCDDLLDMPSVRNELAQRESGDMYYASRGGRGGNWPMLTRKERELRARLDDVEEGQAPPSVPDHILNAGTCVLCFGDERMDGTFSCI